MSEKEQELFEKIEKLEEQIKENPKDIELYLELGDLCIYSMNNKVYKKGMKAWREAFALNPSSQIATKIADSYDFDDMMICAYRYRLKAIKLDPNDPYPYVSLFVTLKYYIESIEHYSPDDKDTPKKKKKALEKLEKYEAIAIEHYKKAFALNPSSQIATKIAIIYEYNHKIACAYRYGLKAIKLEPNNLENYIELFETSNNYIDLLWDYGLDNKDTPKKVEEVSKKLKKYQLKAIPVAKEKLKENPNDYDVLCCLSDLYKEEDIDRALVYGQRAFEVNKEDYRAYYSLMYLYRKKEDYKKLIELYLDVGNYHEAGNIYKLDLKDYHKAIECYKKAIELDDKKALYYQSLGSALNYIKEYKKATHYLKIAKKLTSNSINLVEDRF